MAYEYIKSSSPVPTGTAGYTCFIKVYRNTSSDTPTTIATHSEYLFQLFLKRTTSITRVVNKWTKKHTLDKTSTGFKNFNWPESTITLAANTAYLLDTYSITLPNDGAYHKITMMATCDDGAPKDCNASLTFNAVSNKKDIPEPDITFFDINLSSEAIFNKGHQINANEIVGVWNTVKGAVKYTIEVYCNKKNTDGYTKLYTYTPGTTFFEYTFDKNVIQPGDKIYFKVRANGDTKHNNSAFAVSNVITCGQTAYVKQVARWRKTFAHYKESVNNVKPIRGVWVKIDDTWINAIIKGDV